MNEWKKKKHQTNTSIKLNVKDESSSSSESSAQQKKVFTKQQRQFKVIIALSMSKVRNSHWLKTVVL